MIMTLKTRKDARIAELRNTVAVGAGVFQAELEEELRRLTATDGYPDLLAKAIKFAADAHGSKLDRGGQLAFLHPLAVMLKMETDEERIVAILHDVVEDCGVQVAQLRQYFGDEIADAVDAISRRDGEKYFAYIDRVKVNPLARRVKRDGDLEHNSSPERLGRLPIEERDIVKRYDKAKRILAGGETS